MARFGVFDVFSVGGFGSFHLSVCTLFNWYVIFWFSLQKVSCGMLSM